MTQRNTPLRGGAIAGLCSLAACAALSDGAVAAQADDPRVAFMGRVEMREGAAWMAFPGVSVRFRYQGEAPVLRMRASTADCYFDLSCEGGAPVTMRLAQGENAIALPTGTAPAEGRVVELARRTEAWMGEVALEAIDLAPGSALLEPPARPARRLMFIGDSTTCGEFNERCPPQEEISARTTNALRSYGPLIARVLDAQFHLVAYGGQGIVRDWSGKSEGEHVVLAPDYFERSLPRDPGARWDHARYQPDVVLINVGTDFDAGLPGEASYVQSYASFVRQVRVAHPTAYILLSESNFLSDAPGSEGAAARAQLWRTIEAVVELGRQAGDERIGAVRSSYFPGTPADTHLTAFQHERLARELAGPIRAAAGW